MPPETLTAVATARAQRPDDEGERYLRPGTLHLAALPPLALYVHLPWCLKKCPYCDFNSHSAGTRTRRRQLPEARYLDALRADLEQSLPLIWGRRVTSVFIGGGTPSLFAPALIERLLSDVRARLPLEPGCEITLEANPGTFESERFRGYRAGRRDAAVGRRAELRRRQAAGARPRARRRPGARRARRGGARLRHLEPRPDVRAAGPDAWRSSTPISNRRWPSRRRTCRSTT